MAVRIFAIALAFALIAEAATAGQAQVRYLDLPDSARPQTLAADSSGNLIIIFDVTEPSGRQRIRVIKTNPQGSMLASMDFGEGEAIAGAAVDRNGSLVIAGTTTSPDFPLVSPLISKTSQAAAFIIKIDSSLQNILFSTRLGGTQGGVFGVTVAGALALDHAGNIYVAGRTSSIDFPVTSGAFQTQPPQSNPFGAASYAYLTEIASDGSRIVFSTYFGDSGVTCIGGSHCIGVFGGTGASAIALDATGNVVISGTTDANQLPVTPGVYAQQCGCTSDSPTGFLAKFAAGGAKLLWATYLRISGFPRSSQVTISTMALDSGGNVILGGSLFVATIPITDGALQPALPQPDNSAGFLMRFDSAATQLMFSTYFGSAGFNPSTTVVNKIVLDSRGTIWITGNSDPAELPVPNGTPLLGPSYMAGLSPDGSAITNIFTAPAGTAGQAIATSGGNVIALGSAASLLIASPGPGASLLGIANSAATKVSNTVAPDELISLFGIGIGPAVPANTQVVNGVVTISLGGVQVLFDGVPAPLLYAGPTQINAIVPGEVSGHDTTTLQLITPSGAIGGPTMLIRPTQPGVFLSLPIDPLSFRPYAAALNQDGSVNSASNPAAYGSIVTVWATGGGAVGTADGIVVATLDRGPSLPVSILGSAEGNPGRSLEVLYAGDAPEMVAGVLQVNFRLPERTNLNLLWTFQLQIGDALSQAFQIHLQP